MPIKRDNYRWPRDISTAVTIGPPLEAAKKWTSMLAEDTGIKAHMASTRDGVNRYKWLRYGIVDFIIGGVIEVGPMLEGNWRFGSRDTGTFPIRAMWAASKSNEGFFVRGDSFIRTVYDLRPGVRVVDMSGYLGTRRVLEALLAWSGNFKDIEKEVDWIPAINSDNKVQLVLEGKADLAFAIPTSPEIYEAERNHFGLRWLNLNAAKDPEGARRFHGKHPLVDFGPMVNGVSSSIGQWGMIGTGLFCCRSNADTDFVYNLAKWLDKNWVRYRDFHFRLKNMTINTLMEQLDKTFIPCHDGLIRYLKELGLWTEAHEERQRKNVNLVTRYCVASRDAMWLADEKGIVVSSDNPEWIKLWQNYKKEQALPTFTFLPSLGKAKSAYRPPF